MFKWFMDSLGMATSEVVFFLIFLFGFVIAAGGWIFGGGHEGDHEHAGHDDGGHEVSLSSFLSVRALAMFLTGFGGVAYLVMHLSHKMLLACASGVVSGIIIAAIGLWIIYFAKKQESNSAVTAESVQGATAIVTLEIPPSLVGKGEVQYTASGMQHHAAAMTESETGFKRGATVRIVRMASSFVLVDKGSA
jgi:membrane protein implicated in regulation of membrane protease activity